MKQLHTLVFCVILLIPGMASGFEFNENCRNAYSEMLRLNFTASSALLQLEKKVRPQNAAVYYIEHYQDFIRAFISEEEFDYLQVKNKLDVRLSRIDKYSNVTPWAAMARGEMLFQLAVLKLKRKEYLPAGYYIRRAYKILEENQAKHPAFFPNLKALGFFHALIGSVPENYKWLANLVGMKGTIRQGTRELNHLVNRVESDDDLAFMKDEVYFIRIFIASHFEKNNADAAMLLQRYKQRDQNSNPLQVFVEANTLMVSGKPAEALVVLNTFEPGNDQYPLYYLDYLSGMLRINNLDVDALHDFKKYVDFYKGKSFIKSAYHKMAWISLLKKDTSGYHNYMALVRSAGDDFTDEDKQAMKEATLADIPNVTLLRARLLFDGGNYNGALSELTNKPPGSFSSLKDQLEYTYRLARIFDKKGQTAKAIQYYTTTYQNGMRKEWYFAANAALNNGLIYESNNDSAQAIEWYKKCLSLRNHEYQNSIDQKAEAGLDRMR